MDIEKIKRIVEWPEPKTAEQLRSFMGLAGYYRRFVVGFAAVAAPLHAILPPVNRGKGKKSHEVTAFVWNPEAQAAFDKLKEALTRAPVLAYPDFTVPFVLETNASLKGLGACLTQAGEDGKESTLDLGPPGLFPSWSPEQLAALQRADPELKVVWEYWKNGLVPGEVMGGPRLPREVRLWLWQWPRRSS